MATTIGGSDSVDYGNLTIILAVATNASGGGDTVVVFQLSGWQN
jgi:hypothetical protein